MAFRLVTFDPKINVGPPRAFTHDEIEYDILPRISRTAKNDAFDFDDLAQSELSFSETALIAIARAQIDEFQQAFEIPKHQRARLTWEYVSIVATRKLDELRRRGKL